MAHTTVKTKIPREIVAGTSISWVVSLDDYSAIAGWSLIYTLVNSNGQIIITSIADGDNHLVEVTFSVTAQYAPGQYSWQAHISNGTERYKVDSGQIKILPDFATKGSGFDARDWLDIAIDALEASIQGRASKTQIFQTIGGVQVQHMTPLQQLEVLDKLLIKKSQRNRLKRKSGNTVKVKF